MKVRRDEGVLRVDIARGWFMTLEGFESALFTPRRHYCRFSVGRPLRVAALAALVVIASGCASVRTVNVEVPVPVYCEPPAINEPVKPIDDLAPTADIFEHVRAAWATIERLEGYTRELKAAVDSCRRK